VQFEKFLQNVRFKQNVNISHTRTASYCVNRWAVAPIP